MSGMARMDFARPTSLAQALALAQPDPRAMGVDSADGRLWLAGGQSLLAALKLGMVAPSLLIDLQDVSGLRDIRLTDSGDALSIGAMATHASVAASDVVKHWAPGLAALAGGIADAQVRQMGTLGGSLAHNDPAACWPAGVLAAGATVLTSRREIAVDDYFRALYTTTLGPGELILGVRFPRLKGLHYLKFEQAASRFALVGVAVAVLGDARVRVAITGLGQGVLRWREAEHALQSGFATEALQPLLERGLPGLEALGDLHASADYRRHLAGVLTQRCVRALGGGPLPQRAPLSRRSPNSAAPTEVQKAPREGFGGTELLPASPAQVWHTLLDPARLQASIPGCESLAQVRADAFEATIKVGLGPLTVRFKTNVQLRDLRPPESLNLVFTGQAGALGGGQGTAQVRLEPLADGQTRLHWWVQVQLSGRLAQFGSRLVEATARKLSAEFFESLGRSRVPGHMPAATAQAPPWWRRLLQFLLPLIGK